MTQQIPPHDLTAENALLGALLLAPRQVMKEIGELDPTDFYAPDNQLIYSAIKDYLGAHPQEDPREGMHVPIAGLLKERGELDKVGGEARLLELQIGTPSRSGAVAYARRVRTEAGRFRLLQAAREQAKDVHKNKDLLQALVDSRRRIDEIVAHTDLGRALRTAATSADAYLDSKEQRELGETPGISTGFADLDRLTGGFRPGDTTVLGGRTGQGKTALALTFGLNALRQGHPVLFASLEMAETQLVERIMANLADVAGQRLRDISPDSLLTDEEERKLHAATTEYISLPLTIHDESDSTISRIEGLARLRGIGEGKGLVIVDYLQLLSSEPNVSFGTRQEEVALLSRGLKRMARNLHCHVLALVQIKDVEQGLNPVPALSDVRESRAINNDASVVMLVHRPGLDEDIDTGDFDIHIPKNRNGPSNRRVELLFNGSRMRFSAKTGPNLKLVKVRPDPVYTFGGSNSGSPSGGNAAADALVRRRQERESGPRRDGPLD